MPSWIDAVAHRLFVAGYSQNQEGVVGVREGGSEGGRGDIAKQGMLYRYEDKMKECRYTPRDCNCTCT
jgi:hypothetical protein